MEFDGSVNLKFLQTFILVATEGSFRVAAERMHRSHSAISNQIKTLEQQLGVMLFERTTRSVTLTPEGKQLFESATRAVYEMQQGLRLLRETADFKRGHMSVASSSNIASIHLPAILTAFVRDYPQINVTIRELTSSQLYEALHHREVDFALGPMLENEEFTFTPILKDPVKALLPTAMATPFTTSITWRQLSQLPLLVQSRETAMRRLLDRMMDDLGVSIETPYQFIQGETIIAMVEAGLGAAIQPGSRLNKLSGAEPITVLDLVDPPIERTMALIMRRNQVLSPAAKRFADRILQGLSNNSA
ncbi:MAG: LysR family transcriptional regulator [Halomonas sp.]|nr:LysR family transcriptional regulator [Halomonas sp.]MBP5979869.1 LysR family transcriptional regulator [Halomonas sp.]